MNWKKSFYEAARYSDPDRPMHRDSCPHDQRAYRRFEIANGREEVRHQCLRCGDRSKVIPKAQVQALGLRTAELPFCEPDDSDRLTESYRRTEAQRIKKWFDAYSLYLQSPQWQLIRERILNRDGRRCQGCLQEDAVEAHHLTYENIGDEFLFELVAIGPRCHKRLRLSQDKIPR